jgi:PAS domain S-box-containing protein
MKNLPVRRDIIETEVRYKALHETINDIIYTHDLEWNIISVNPAVERILGYTAEELIGKNALTFIHNDSALLIKSRLEAKLENPNKKSESLELVILTKDGREKWIEVNATILASQEGAPLAVQGIARDITDRKQTEQELLKSERKYRAIFENTNASMGIVEEDNVLSLVNSEFEKLSGYSKKEIEGRKKWMSFVDSRDLERMMGYHTLRMQGRDAPRNYEFRFVCKDSETKHVFITVAFIDGTSQLVISLTDLTEQKKAEVSLKESEARYRTFLDATTDLAFMKDDNFRYVLANRAFLIKNGFREESEILGKRDNEVLPSDCVKSAARSDELALSTGGLVVMEEQMRDYLFEARKFPVVLKNGKTGIGAIVRNITEVRQAEEEKKRLETALVRAGKLEVLGTLAGGVAHDLNNVLGGMVSLPSLLLDQLPSDSPMKRPLELIQRSGEKAAAIVEDMLTLARRGVSNAKTVNLNEVITTHFESPEHDKLQFFHQNVRFQMLLEDKLLNIIGSPVHLYKTVMNLLSNAAEAMPHGGTVTIRTENRHIDKSFRGYDDIKEGDYAVLTVRDMGVGIPPDGIDRIFEPFFTKKVMGRSGTGLGMTVVWGTVKDHNGYIDVQSEEGKGTIFTLYFPATRKKRPDEIKHVPAAEYRGKGETILIVDDVPEQLELASSMLSDLGYKPVTACSGEIAIEYLKKNCVDLMILDMIMEPGIDGLETYRKILKIRPRQKAVIGSGYSETKSVKAAQKLGAGAYIKKPYTLESIGIAIRNELNKASV